MEYVLRLYVSRRAPSSVRALRNLRELCEAELPGRYELEIIDVIEDPDRADADRILATPTLLRVAPPPAWRIIGDLEDRPRLHQELVLP